MLFVWWQARHKQHLMASAQKQRAQLVLAQDAVADPWQFMGERQMTIEERALALVNEIEREEGENELTRRIMRGLIMDEALCRAIEQHEAFRQEVSDALHEYFQVDSNKGWGWGTLERFIIPKPQPDPLAQALGDFDGTLWEPEDVLRFRAKLDALGFEIREKNDV